MQRRALLKRLALLGFCPLCAGRGFAAEEPHWSYQGYSGPEHWGALAKENAACSAGSQQSPVDIVASTKADLPELKLAWLKEGGKMINNGHTVQLNVPPGGRLAAGADTYELVQFHFHAPSEHLVDGKRFAMEAHFVHSKANGSGLGVLGVFLSEGRPNPTFGLLAEAFPKRAGNEVAAPTGADPSGLVPTSLAYWKYEGSLTTPPCSETVDWLVCVGALEVAKADVAKFTALYPMNARPVQRIDRRFILRST
jgi:carbonic anhydrase